MSTPILCLSVLVLLCAAFPSQLFRFNAGRAASGSGLKAAARTLAIPTAMLVIALWAWYLAPTPEPDAIVAAWHWYLIAVAVGAATVAAEIGVGALHALARRRPISAVALHSRVSDRSWVAVLSVVVVAAAEEIIFRGLGVYLLSEVLNWPAAAAIALAAVVYGLNHAYYGWLTVAQKVLAGVVYGGLFVYSGHALTAVIVAHAVQNVVVLTVLPRLGVRT